MSEKEQEVQVTAKEALEDAKIFNEDEYSEEELSVLAKLYSESFYDIKEGEIITGKIVGIFGDNVVVDVGFKSTVVIKG